MSNESILRSALEEAAGFIARLTRQSERLAIRMIETEAERLEDRLFEALERAPMPITFGPVETDRESLIADVSDCASNPACSDAELKAAIKALVDSHG